MCVNVYKYLMQASLKKKKKMQAGSSQWYPVKGKEGTGAN